MRQLRSAGIVVYCKDTAHNPLYLLLQHSNGGHWSMPKGKIEEGETKQEAAVRELDEETGLSVELDKDFEEMVSYLFQDTNGEQIHKTVSFFIGYADTDSITLSHEHLNYRWLLYEDAIRQLTYEKDKELLKKAHYHIIR